jgi:ATP-dependent RNA helicase SUPV3L1/SUV3
VRIGAFALFLPELAGPALAFARAFALAAAPDWRPAEGRLASLPAPAPGPRAIALRGLVAVGGAAVPITQLERLDELLRSAARQGGGVLFSDQAREELGWSEPEARSLLRALGFAPVGRGPTQVWRRKAEPKPRHAAPTASPGSPFAALAALKPAEPRRGRRPQRRRPQAARHG